MVSGRPRDLYFASTLNNSIAARDSFIDILFAVFILGSHAIRENKRVLIIGSSDYLVAAVVEVSLTTTLIITCNSCITNIYS